MSASELLERLRMTAPEITAGPLVRTKQFWVSTGRHLRGSAAPSFPDWLHLVEPHELSPIPASTKPFDIGLYTSTGVFGSFGMWWAYLQFHAGSTLFPSPWTIWAMEAVSEASVLEITTATEWVDFVLYDPICEAGLLYPNWRRAAERWDGIHMTARAVATTQGIPFTWTNRSAIAPPYWDVESTLWLRWCFKRVAQVDANT